MPPSPLVRISPGRGLKSDSHKRGRSLEGGILYSEKDDDLALFNEVQNKERDNFLLRSSNDDFDDIFSSKLRYFSDNKNGISTHTRGESSDLLNGEGDKNDYDWLITPPETPLFTSLDDETPANNLGSRGRPRSQPISISRSSTMEKGYGSSRGSPSPHRLSPSPQSGNTSLQSRSRPFPATHSSPPLSVRRPSSPTRKPSPPPSKTAPHPRSHTPTLRRMSTGSSNSSAAPSKTRGTSPVKTSRGSSASPKIRAWQANIPGFSSEAPPNLRTSLGDRPASYVRGSSPAASSRNGSKSGRHSMSPTASRSISSSHSNEKEPYGSHSKGSIASSGDDDVDSSLSGPVSCSDYLAPRSLSGYPGNKTTGTFKKPSKVLSSSAPKRSFDMAIRQIERKGPQNMFRPMLSSVPSATIYAGKGSYLTSINSSITTSSNASSDQGTSGAVDIEESGQNQEEVSSDFYQGEETNKHDEEVFVLDQIDTLNEGDEYKMAEESAACEHDKIDGPPSDIPPTVVPGHISRSGSEQGISASEVVSDKMYEDRDIADLSDKELCSICGQRFRLGEIEREGVSQLCRECWISRVYSTVLDKNANGGIVLSLEDMSQVNSTGEIGEVIDTSFNEGQQPYISPSHDVGLSPIEEVDVAHSAGKVGHTTSESNENDLQISANISEGSGISLLLKRSNSRGGHVVQSRSLTASNISYDELSYVRDSINSMRSSVGYSSASASLSSSVDLGSSKQMEARIHRQSSGHKSDAGNYRYETPAKLERSISSLSGASGHGQNAANADNELGEATSEDPLELSVASEYAESNSVSNLSRDDLVESNANFEELALQENCETSTNKTNDTMKEDTSSSGHVQGQDAVPSSCDERICDAENPHISSLHAISVVEIENGDPIDSKRCTNDSRESPSAADSDFVTPTVEDARSDAVHDIREESTVVFEDLNGKKSKSMTLEEATDAILFCRSIVHDIAYEAADIAIEKEGPSPTMEALRLASTYTAKSKLERREARSRTAGKRGVKSQKARQRKMDSDAKPPVDETDVTSTPTRTATDPSKGDGTKPPMKLESKCNCVIM